MEDSYPTMASHVEQKDDNSDHERQEEQQIHSSDGQRGEEVRQNSHAPSASGMEQPYQRSAASMEKNDAQCPISSPAAEGDDDDVGNSIENVSEGSHPSEMDLSAPAQGPDATTSSSLTFGYDAADDLETITSHVSDSSKRPSLPGPPEIDKSSIRQVSFGATEAMPHDLDSPWHSSDNPPVVPMSPEEQSISVNDDTTEAGDSVYSRDTSQGLDGEEYEEEDSFLRPSLKDLVSSSNKMLVQSNKRLSLSMDLETGIEGGTRSHQASIRVQPDDYSPRSSAVRRRRGMQAMIQNSSRLFTSFARRAPKTNEQEKDEDFKPSTHGHFAVRETQVIVGEGDDDAVGEDSGIKRKPRTQVQYNLQTIQERGPSRGQFSQVLSFASTRGGLQQELNLSRQKGLMSCGDGTNGLVIRYLHWAFRSSFLAVFCSGALAFFSLTILFAGMILVSGTINPSCIHVNGVDFGTTGANFMDAYALSWTTFSTVGYGLVFPATSTTNQDIRQCTGITILTTLESFVGILYASICGAILFAKVTRIASFAQVTFSDPIVVRYGSGVVLGDGEDEEDDDDDAKSSDDGGGELSNYEFEPPKATTVQLSNLPCPILEFRVVNRLHGVFGGEIIDGSMNIVASVDEKQGISSRHAASGPRRRGKKGKRRGQRRRGKRSSSANGSQTSSMSEGASRRLEKARESVRELFRTPSGSPQTDALVPEGLFHHGSLRRSRSSRRNIPSLSGCGYVDIVWTTTLH